MTTRARRAMTWVFREERGAVLAEMRGVVSYDRDARVLAKEKRHKTFFHFERICVSIKTLPYYRVAPSRRRHRALAPDAPRGFVPGVPASPRPPRGRGRGRPRDRGRGEGFEVPVVLRGPRDGDGDGDGPLRTPRRRGRRREGNRRGSLRRGEREAVRRVRGTRARRRSIGVSKRRRRAPSLFFAFAFARV